ncbi:MAG: hypothetical protein ACC628_14905 [Pirellulaceae bacterium]
MKQSVLLTGDCMHKEFERPLAWLSQHCQVTQLPGLERARSWLAAGESFPKIMVVAQPRPGRYWQAQIEKLHAAAPLARLVALLGSWCEGETCSGDPWSGAIRVFWYEFVARMEAELDALEKSRGAWSLPRTATNAEMIACGCISRPATRGGLIAVGTASAVVYEGLADACAQAGFSTAWLPPTQPCRIKSAAVGIWDETGRGARDFQNLKTFARRLSPAPALALLGFPRRYECEQAMAVGAADVLPKPFLVDDLLIRLTRLMN